jgi:polyisoprenoid-binding protein YceI
MINPCASSTSSPRAYRHLSVSATLCWLLATNLLCAADAPDTTSPDQKTVMTNGHLGDCHSCHGKPDPSRFMVDPKGSRVVFRADNFGFGATVGEFHGVEGGFSYDPDKVGKIFAVATIHADTVDLGDPLLNAVVRERFLNVEKFPVMTFVATDIQRSGSDAGKLVGNFTMLGVTKSVTLDVHFNKLGRHPLTGDNSAGFTATGSLKRSDYGERLGLPAIGDEITFEITIMGKNLQ